ncbi:MAG: hypothetical protein WBB57_07525 [Mycobacterium sp.]
MHAMNVGLTEDEFVTVTAASEFAWYFATEDKGRDRTARLVSRLRKVWERCEDDWAPPIGSAEDVRRKLEQLSQRIDRYTWPPRTARTDHAVATALVGWAHEIGVWTIDASERDLSIRAGVGRETASRALSRLVDLGLLSRDDRATRRRTDASRWRINLGWQQGLITQMGPHDSRIGGRGSCGLNNVISHPVFVGSALGQNSGRVWADLAEHPESTAADIAQRLGLTARAVRAVVTNKLEPHGLVTQSGIRSGRGRPTPTFRLNPEAPTLDDIAERLDVADWADRTTARYSRERGGFREVHRQRQARDAEDGQIAAEVYAELAEVAEQRRRDGDTTQLLEQMGLA